LPWNDARDFAAGGYGGIEVSDCVIVPGLDHALALAWKGDNQGPHTVDEALAVFQQLEVASTAFTLTALQSHGTHARTRTERVPERRGAGLNL
jgi:hypothetical protein